MEKAELDYSLKRVFRKILLTIQETPWIPLSLRVYFIRLGGVKLGSNCWIGSNVSFDTLRPDLISIGNGCCVTSGTKIISHFMRPDENAMFYDKITIGERVFIGMNTLIVNSVKIGDDAVIGAGSVVLKDIPANEIWAGNPAKFIRKRNSNVNETIN